MSKLAVLTDSSLIRKRNFLNYYYIAKKEALSAKIIKSGWKATGLWPKSITKPLMSPLLLKNSNLGKETLQTVQSSIESQKIDLPEIILFTS